MSKYKIITKLMVKDYLELDKLTLENKDKVPHTELGLKYEIDKSAAGELWRGVRMGMLQKFDNSKYGLIAKQMYDDGIVIRIGELTYKEVGELYKVDGIAAMNILIGLDAVNKIEKLDNSRNFGHIEGIHPGQIFSNRKELAEARVHKPHQAGISGSQLEGADSIVLSGGYEDDEDSGNIIIYTGAGGNKNGKQVSDQELIGTNLALAKSKLDGCPVRVVRGYTHKSPFSPKSGYLYSGLYRVTDYWNEKGKSGYKVWRFRLELIEGNIDNLEKSKKVFDESDGSEQTHRILTTSNRIKRDSKLANKIKKLYDYKCQVCGISLITSAGFYVEAAHIKPLGKPHNGPDKSYNLICLCPNHHVMFDNGGFTINSDLTLNGIKGSLFVDGKHELDLSCIEYHRTHYSNNLE